MPKQEAPLHQLRQYLPEGAFDDVSYYLLHYKVHLTVTRERNSVLGDYRNAHANRNHRISVNGNLNPFAFLVTLLHELAHLFTYERFGHRVQAHGVEWKQEYGKLLALFLGKKIFPADVERVLLRTLRNPAASSCADDDLLRVLRNYDEKKDGVQLVESLAPGSLFRIKGGRLFKMEGKIRKRFRCVEVATGRIFLFSPVYEVEPAD